MSTALTEYVPLLTFLTITFSIKSHHNASKSNANANATQFMLSIKLNATIRIVQTDDKILLKTKMLVIAGQKF